MNVEPKMIEMPPVVVYESEKDFLREQTERMRSAAFIAYGALIACNTDGRADAVLKLLDATLFLKSDT